MVATIAFTIVILTSLDFRARCELFGKSSIFWPKEAVQNKQHHSQSDTYEGGVNGLTIGGSFVRIVNHPASFNPKIGFRQAYRSSAPKIAIETNPAN